MLYQQAIEIKQLKQIATLKYKYISSQTVEFPPLVLAARDHSTLQTQNLFRSLVRPASSLFERTQS